MSSDSPDKPSAPAPGPAADPAAGPASDASQAARVVVLHTRVVSGTGGGPEKTILLSAPFLAHTRYALSAAYMYPPGDAGFEIVRQRAQALNSPLIPVPDRGKFDLAVIWRMLRLCKRLRVDVWHGHDYKSNLLGLLLRPFHRMRLVTTLHGWVKHDDHLPLYYKIDRWCLPRYERVIAVSEDLVEAARKAGVREERLTYVPNAIDERAFRRAGPAAQAPMRRERGFPEGRLLVGAMGRLSEEKSFDLLIRAVADLLGQGHDLGLWIAGEGDAKPQLQALIDSLGVGDRVRLLGFCKDTVAFHEALDVFVLSSQREGLPNVVLEAAAMETPLVSTRVAGIPKMLTHERDALLCDIGDLDGLTQQVRRLVTDPALRRDLARAARALIEERYGFARRMQRIQAIYDRLLGFAPTPDAEPAPAPVPGLVPDALATSTRDHP